jgi:hypothetical protein
MVSAGSFLLYIVLGFSGQRNLLITANVVERRALGEYQDPQWDKGYDRRSGKNDK